jgi:hypothetical protein
MIRKFVSQLSSKRGRPSSHFTAVNREPTLAGEHKRRLFSLYKSNENHEMAIRHAKFNMNELAKRAAESVGFTLTQCVHIAKFPDGMHKAFLFTMQDGTQVVDKVPNPNAGRAHYTTASEVATMDFVSRLSPIPPAFILMLHSQFRNELHSGTQSASLESQRNRKLSWRQIHYNGEGRRGPA